MGAERKVHGPLVGVDDFKADADRRGFERVADAQAEAERPAGTRRVAVGQLERQRCVV